MAALHRIETGFLARAHERPDALALSSAYGAMTYGELEQASATFAARLSGAAASTAKTVAILADRGPRVVIAALACLRANRPFVVLDLAYPAARLQTLVEIARPGVLVLAGRDAEKAAARFELPTLALGAFAEAKAQPLSLPTAEASPDDPAYLLFTSGSTGAPKGVACSHRPLVNFVAWQARTFGLNADDRFTMLSGLSHDPILRDIFTPLSLGASIHIPSQSVLTAPGGLRAWFGETRVTVAHITPQLGGLLTTGAAASERLPDLRRVFWGGDVLRRASVKALARLAPDCESVNFYGATETPQAVAFHRVAGHGPDGALPIGRAVDGFTLQVVDATGRPAPNGEPGEIVVRSQLLTLGYVRDGMLPQARTEEAFYATGDVGVMDDDGQITVRGRSDDQLKIRGFRVEMAEITAAALAFPTGVAQAITLNVGDRERPRLCSFVQPAEGRVIDTDALRRHLEMRLPAYMVPERIVATTAMPLLPNGKIDRQALIAAEQAAAVSPATADATLAGAEAVLVAKWSDVFPGRPVTRASSFAGLGGDSLSYVNAYLGLEQVLGRVPEGWTTLAIEQLAAGATRGVKRGLFASLESAMVLRALAIVLVVASHFQLVYSGGAATSALFWVSGFLFGGLQLRECDRLKSLEPIARLLRGVAVPLAVLTFPIIALKAVTHHGVDLSNLLMNVDLLDYTQQPPGPDYLLWYVHCVVHMLLIIGGLVLGFRLLRVRRPALAAIVTAAILGALSRFILPAFYLPDFWRAPVAGLSVFGHSPTAHLATFALAALAGLLDGRKRQIALAVTLAYAALSGPSYGWIDSAAIAATAAALVLAPRLRLPRVLQAPIYATAGASLFIYLLHFRFLQIVNGALHLPVIAAFAAAIVGGVAAWRAWNFGAKILARGLPQLHRFRQRAHPANA
ncbi:MAG TPA: amino acid adenylation domain-containing protein [Caulobacteraceae bacterium]|jgi:amino acid adenylation domain-containing protein|nr:amino acid adenylation domain-containing protein [Caulobacteraceae bacterium]